MPALALGILLIFLLGCGSSATVVPRATVAPATIAPATTSTPTIRPTSTRRPSYTPVAVGRARELPMPLGRSVTYEDGMALTVLGMIGPAEAAAAIRQSNMFNREAGADEEWVLVAVEYGCSARSGTCRFSEFQFQLVGRRGVAYRVPLVVLPDEYDPSQTLYPGGMATVTIPFLVKDSDANFVLVWERGLMWPTAYFQVVSP